MAMKEVHLACYLVLLKAHLPKVSGKMSRTRMPPSREKPPMMTKGKGIQTLPRVATGGATIPPIRPHSELAPTAVLLR